MKSIVIMLMLASTVTAQEDGTPTTLQFMKAFGYAVDVTLEEAKAGRATPETAAIESVISEERLFCGRPNAFDVEVAHAELDVLADTLGYPEDICRDIRGMHLELEEARTRSWPKGCDPRYPNHAATTYYVDRSTFRPFHHAPVSDRWLQGLVTARVWGFDNIEQARKVYGGMSLLDASLKLGLIETYRPMGLGMFETQDRSKANIVIVGKVLPGSLIGYAYYNDGTCSDVVTMVIDISWEPPVHGNARLFGHEGGHNNNLEHEFPGQQATRAVMGYTPPSGDIYYGFSTGKAPHSLPLDPSVKHLVGYFGSDPFPSDSPVTPTPGPTPNPPPTGPVNLGDTVTLVIGGTTYEAKVSSIRTGTGPITPTPPTLAFRMSAAIALVPAHPKKADHKDALVMIYQSVAQGVEEGKITVADGQAALAQLRPLLLGGDVTHWRGVFAVADSVTTAEDLRIVADTLNSNEALSPQVLAVIRLIVALLPEGRLKTIVNIILAILDGAKAVADEPPVKVSPVQKQGEIRMGEFDRVIAYLQLKGDRPWAVSP